MADMPQLSVRLLKGCMLPAGSSKARALRMASMESGLAAFVLADGSAVICELWSKLRFTSHSGFDNTGSGAAWDSNAVGAAVAKGTRLLLGLVPAGLLLVELVVSCRSQDAIVASYLAARQAACRQGSMDIKLPDNCLEQRDMHRQDELQQ